MQQNLLPSTRQLIAFETCAQTLSITASATALHLTQSAVSHQIKDLESYLGTQLFIRQKQRLSLTAEGKQYALDIQNILKQLRQATQKLTSKQYASELHLALLPTLGTRWLMPLIPEFCKQHPEINIHFSSTLLPFDFSVGEVDASLHYGTNQWSDAHMVKLFDEEVIPVCSPAFLQQHPIPHAESIAQLPRLTLNTRQGAWADWFQLAHVDNQHIQPSNNFSFDHFTTMAQAACSGLGIALLPKFLFREELDKGDLVLAIDKPMTSQGAYYFAYPKHKSQYRPVMAFLDWIISCDING